MQQMIKEKIAASQRIVITSHQAPDGDAIGSSLALYHYLLKKEKEVTMIVPDAPPAFLCWMRNFDQVHVYESEEEFCKLKIQEADIIFSLDYNDLKRVGIMGESIATCNGFKCMIDHHLYPSDFADFKLSKTNVGSTAQLIFEFIDSLNDKNLIDTEIGEGIYTGILTDTGSFRFPSVDVNTHLIAAHLICLGLDHSRIHENIYDTNTISRLSFLGFALNQRLKVLPDLPVAMITLTVDDAKAYNIEKGDTEGLVNWALSIKGVQMAAFIREDKDKVKLSFRSKGDIPVNEFSGQYFEGGGHKNAAGGVSYATLSETIALFEKKVYEFMAR
jgi:bifunctional oligoribonuclease and PAP phosphatase NrnA